MLLRFGRWDDVLAAPDHPDYLPFTRAFRHAARGIAFAAKNDVAAARLEEAAFLEAVKLVPAEENVGNNSASAVVAIAAPMLAGEIAVREGKLDVGFAKSRGASRSLLERAAPSRRPERW